MEQENVKNGFGGFQPILDSIAGCTRVSFATEKAPGTYSYHRTDESADLRNLAAFTVSVSSPGGHCLEAGTAAVIIVQPELAKADGVKYRIRGSLRESCGDSVGFSPEMLEILDATTNECFRTFKIF